MLTGFEKLFDAALKQSSLDENKVADAVMNLRAKGYDPCEITQTLRTYGKKLIAEEESAIVSDALEEIEGWCKREE